ncbi:MAG: hypothetical protein PHP00_01650 [Thiotrichaceae bacterium]|nr:hypothetical protein [Thiotrichaceae bacterium]
MSNPATEYYPVAFVYKSKRKVFIWETNKDEGDTFKLDESQHLVYADSEGELKEIIESSSLELHWNEASEENFDKFFGSLSRLNTRFASSTKTCRLLLDGWNLIEDLLRTFNLKEESERLKSPVLNKAYEKLFSGCNLPSVTPENKSYSPLWLADEIILLRKELRFGWHFLSVNNYIPF